MENIENPQTSPPTPETQISAPVVETKEVKRPPILKPIWIKLLIGWFVILFLLFIVVIFLRPRSAIPTPPVLPSQAPSASPIEASTSGKLSEIALTEEFQRFETGLNDLVQQNNQVNLSENELSFPFLDFAVTF